MIFTSMYAIMIVLNGIKKLVFFCESLIFAEFLWLKITE